jgi:hypothetical protein
VLVSSRTIPGREAGSQEADGVRRFPKQFV